MLVKGWMSGIWDCHEATGVHLDEHHCIVQARTSSSRLPGKVLQPTVKPMVIYQLDRLKRCTRIDRVVLGFSHQTERRHTLAGLVADAGFPVFRGDLEDVLERFRACAASEKPQQSCVSGDCPLSDPA